MRWEIHKRAEETLWNRYMAEKERYEVLSKTGIECTYPETPNTEQIFNLAKWMKDFVEDRQ